MNTLVIFSENYNWDRFQPKLFKSFDSLAIHPDFQVIKNLKWYPDYINIIDYKKAIPFDLLYFKIKKGFINKILINADLDKFTNLEKDNYIVYKSQFLATNDSTKIKKEQIIESEFFKSFSYSKIGNLSFSIRYACFLGYKRIILKGVFREHIFEVVNTIRDLDNLGYEIEVLNGDLKSRDLFDNVLPYTNLDLQKKRRILNAIAVPTIEKELPLILYNFKHWDKPEFLPYINFPKQPNVDLVFFYGQQKNEDIEQEIYKAFHETKYVKHCIRNVRFKYANLTDKENIYSQSYIDDPVSVHFKKSPEGGYKVGPNNVFYYMIENMSEYDYIFQMETDCIAIRKNWLWKMQNLVENYPHDFWLMGSIYRGLSELDPVFKTHINGNAFYATGDKSFQEFMTDIFRPWMDEYIATKDPRIAFDIGHQIYLNQSENWPFVQSHIQKFVYTEYVQNLAGHPKFTGGDRNNIHVLKDLYPDTYLVHGKMVRLDLPEDKLKQGKSSAEDSEEIQQSAQIVIEGGTYYNDRKSKISNQLNNVDDYLLSIQINFDDIPAEKEHNIINLGFVRISVKNEKLLAIFRNKKRKKSTLELIEPEKKQLIHMRTNKAKNTLYIYINGLLYHIKYIENFKASKVHIGNYEIEKSWTGSLSDIIIKQGVVEMKDNYRLKEFKSNGNFDTINIVENSEEYLEKKSLII